MVIFGDGKTAGNIAQDLLGKGMPVLLVSPGQPENGSIFGEKILSAEDLLTILPDSTCLACRGSAGKFNLLLTAETGIHAHDASVVVVAQQSIREPNYSQYGLVPSRGVISLSDLDVVMAGPWAEKKGCPQSVAFLNGLTSESNPVIFEEMLKAILKMQMDDGFQTYIFTGNLKVAAAGLEKRYRETKEAGAIYIKFATEIPEISQAKDSRVSIRYIDELTGDAFGLSPEFLVVDETIRPAPQTEKLAKILKIELDQSGFAQADNVHRTVVATNRKGIYVAGPSRIVQPTDSDDVDAGVAALLAYRNAPAGAFSEQDDRARIETEKCVRCLTCIRVCPYHAVSLDPKPVVDARLCERCGICAAECPVSAIRIPGLEVADVRKTVHEGQVRKNEQKVQPRIVAFCCSRSAQQAGELFRLLERKGTESLQIVEVPCGGAIAQRFLLESFLEGADGVLVLACHPDNCHSSHGNRFAKNRTIEIQKRLAVIGLQAERLEYASLASNMAAEFGEIVHRFESKLSQMGPSPLG